MRRFGLIGFPLSHSFSKKYFTEKFARLGLTDCVYENFSLASIEELPGIITRYPDLEGLNVTIPHKENVLPYLDERDAVVQAVGACNCIRVTRGRLSGFNTDVTGFEQSLAPLLQPYHREALVLGTGGAAKAVTYVLDRRGIAWKQVSRTPRIPGQISYGEVTPDLLKTCLLIINTTPVGQTPHTDACPPIPYGSLSTRHYLFDLVYNPERTLFLVKGAEQGAVVKNGMDMLAIQAEAGWKIWNAAF